MNVRNPVLRRLGLAKTCVLAAITSQIADEPHTVFLDDDDLADGSLPKQSLVKLGKIFTIHSALILKKLCRVRSEKMKTILGQVKDFYS